MDVFWEIVDPLAEVRSRLTRIAWTLDEGLQGCPIRFRLIFANFVLGMIRLGDPCRAVDAFVGTKYIPALRS